MPLIKIKDLSRSFGRGDSKTRALRRASFSIKRGEFVAIIGPSGSGKSTLMHILGFLDRPSRGTYLFADSDTADLSDSALAELRRNRVGFVFQQINLMPRHTALENVALPMIYSRVPQQDRLKRATKLLGQVGLKDRLGHTPAELSGGQMQKVAIARALANDPELILADEPTGNLDSASGKAVLEELKRLHGQGRTVIIVTHDDSIAAAAERVLTVLDGELIGDSKAKKTARAKNAKKPAKTAKRSATQTSGSKVSAGKHKPASRKKKS